MSRRPVITNEAVVLDTPARSATCCSVTRVDVTPGPPPVAEVDIPPTATLSRRRPWSLRRADTIGSSPAVRKSRPSCPEAVCRPTTGHWTVAAPPGTVTGSAAKFVMDCQPLGRRKCRTPAPPSSTHSRVSAVCSSRRGDGVPAGRAGAWSRVGAVPAAPTNRRTSWAAGRCAGPPGRTRTTVRRASRGAGPGSRRVPSRHRRIGRSWDPAAHLPAGHRLRAARAPHPGRDTSSQAAPGSTAMRLAPGASRGPRRPPARARRTAARSCPRRAVRPIFAAARNGSDA